MMKKDNNFLVLKQLISKRKDIHFYQEDKFIPAELIKEIITTALRAPSSYGFEPWHILSINRSKNLHIIKEIFPFFQNNRQILRCSHLFFIFSYTGEAFNFSTPLFQKKVAWKYGHESFQNKLKGNERLMKDFNPSYPKRISSWARHQCFIPLQNFLLLFTSLNIATSPMGGFDEKRVISYFEKKEIIPKGKYNLAVTFAAGYPLNEEQWEKKKLLSEWKDAVKMME